MGRPKLKEGLKRIAKSISCPQWVWGMSDSTYHGNASKFVEDSVSACTGIRDSIEGFRKAKTKKDREEHLEMIFDIIDAWDAKFDEAVELDKAGFERVYK